MKDFNCKINNGTTNISEHGTINSNTILVLEDKQSIGLENEKNSNINELIEIECEIKFNDIVSNKDNWVESIKKEKRRKG